MKGIFGLLVIMVFLLALAAGCTTQTVSNPETVEPTEIPTTNPTLKEPAPEQTIISDPSLMGTWYLKLMSEQGGTTQVQMINPEITLIFENDSTITGYSGCNTYQGNYILTSSSNAFGKGIVIQPLVSTKKYCADSNTTEATYLEILQGTTSYVLNVNEELSFQDEKGNSLVYQRMPYSETAVPLGS